MASWNPASDLRKPVRFYPERQLPEYVNIAETNQGLVNRIKFLLEHPVEFIGNLIDDSMTMISIPIFPVHREMDYQLFLNDSLMEPEFYSLDGCISRLTLDFIYPLIDAECVSMAKEFMPVEPLQKFRRDARRQLRKFLKKYSPILSTSDDEALVCWRLQQYFMLAMDGSWNEADNLLNQWDK